mgnify:CR=1 FL=1
MKARYSTIFIRESDEWVKVRITSNDKPEISQKILEKWQAVLDLAARFIDVPAGLIMQLNEDNIKVFLRSSTDGNPFEKGEESDLKHGLYCETVCGTKRELLIPNALKDSLWREDNPDLLVDMISYLGVPIRWPDGEIFGSFCVLDNKENSYSDMFKEYLISIRDSVEKDLHLLYKAIELDKKNLKIKEVENVKNKVLSIFYHDVFGNMQQVKANLQQVVENIDEIDAVELRGHLKKLNEQTAQSHKVLEDVLLWSKDDILNLPVSVTVINISDSIETILNAQNQALELKRIKVHKSLPKDGIFISLDKNMLETALKNILSFTIEYSNVAGMIWIRAYQEKDTITIEIEDNGLGFTQEFLSVLFKKDFNLDKDKIKDYNPKVDLLVAKEFLTSNRGKLSVESLVGKGTKFIVKIKSS